jgi:hypothetical protein
MAPGQPPQACDPADGQPPFMAHFDAGVATDAEKTDNFLSTLFESHFMQFGLSEAERTNNSKSLPQSSQWYS